MNKQISGINRLIANETSADIANIKSIAKPTSIANKVVELLLTTILGLSQSNKYLHKFHLLHPIAGHQCL